MKKVALSLLALAVVAAGAFADAPKWDPKVSTEFKGAASVTLGYDLDTGLSAFSNDTSVTLIIDLISGGDKTTTSDADVWGEIKIKTDGDPVRIKADDKDSDATTAYDNGFKLQVDFAKIHFGKAAYLSVTSHDTKLGYSNSPDLAFVGHWFNHNYGVTYTYTGDVYVATGAEVDDDDVYYVDNFGGTVAFDDLVVGATYKRYTKTGGALTGDRYGKDQGALVATNASVGSANAGGIEFGYTLDKVASLTVDVGTLTAWSTDFVNSGAYSQIAYAAKVGILLVENLTAEVGYSGETTKDSGMVVGGKLAYKYAIDGEKLYVKPQVGFVNITPAKAVGTKAYNSATASLLIGTGPKGDAFDNYGLKYADSDYGSYPGLAAGVFYNDQAVVYETGTKKAVLGLNVSVNSGSLIEGSTVVAAYDVADLNATDVKTAITLGFASSIKNGDVTISPKGFLVSESLKNAFVVKDTDTTSKAADSALFAKFDTEITGVIPFVTFNLAYASNDLVNGFLGLTAGKFVADKFGKLEFTTKVNF